MANGTYTQEGIMDLIFVAFGQGTGAIRVSQAAAVALRSLYFDAITAEVVETRWAEEKGQVLERIRAIGRLAALTATQRGDTKVTPEDVNFAAKTVEKQSDTDLCPPRWP